MRLVTHSLCAEQLDCVRVHRTAGTHYVIMLITHYGEFLQLDPTTISCCYTQPPYPDTPTTISYWHDVIPLGTYLAWVAITNFGASPSTSPLLNEATI